MIAYHCIIMYCACLILLKKFKKTQNFLLNNTILHPYLNQIAKTIFLSCPKNTYTDCIVSVFIFSIVKYLLSWKTNTNQHPTTRKLALQWLAKNEFQKKRKK